MAKKHKIQNLQILRAVAAISVVTFHVAENLEINGHPARVLSLFTQKGFSGGRPFLRHIWIHNDEYSDNYSKKSH
jgi:peptidoglycan/LPS O-acetylase OafA/YrhL